MYANGDTGELGLPHGDILGVVSLCTPGGCCHWGTGPRAPGTALSSFLHLYVGARLSPLKCLH